MHCNNVILTIFFASFMAAFLRLQTDLLSFDQNVQKVLRGNFKECVGKRNFIYWQDVQLLFFVHRQMTNYALTQDCPNFLKECHTMIRMRLECFGRTDHTKTTGHK